MPLKKRILWNFSLKCPQKDDPPSAQLCCDVVTIEPLRQDYQVNVIHYWYGMKLFERTKWSLFDQKISIGMECNSF